MVQKYINVIKKFAQLHNFAQVSGKHLPENGWGGYS